jgi:hypothetical protein
LGEDRLTGACLCGGVRFELAGAMLRASYCHCTRCQRRSGTAASANARVAPGSVRLSAGEELLRDYEPPDGAVKVFCAVCGSALFTRDRETRELRSVRLGAFDRDPGVRPSFRQFVAYAAPWEPIPDDGLPRYPEERPRGG